MFRIAMSRTPGVAWGILCLILVVGRPARGEELRDGMRFDPGATMTEPAPNAPPGLARLVSTLGDWDVSYRLYRDGAPAHTASGRAQITFMNRGHAYMERFHCPEFNGEGDDLTTVSFLMFDPAASVWVLGVASSWRENISLFDGDFEEETLVLRNDVRKGGGSLVTHYRIRSRVTGEDEFEASLEQSTDGSDWQLRVVKSYRRRPESDDLFVARTPYGTPASDVPPEARQFDFLIGEWDEVHDMKLPSGPVQFPAHGTAVYCLNGHGIMEFSWYDVDTNLPDAATCIVRLYNRNMRRWECMYSANRFNNILHFGGVQEGDRIVLHRFGVDTADIPINYWIFHDMEEDSYRWHAETSRNRGVTFDDTWKIQGTRKLDD
jgi:hypothetical protein